MKQRSKNKIQNSYTMRNIYDDYIKDKTYEDPYYIDFNTFLKLCKEYNNFFIDQIIFHSQVINLPGRLGNVSVGKKIPKVLSSSTIGIDWELSKQYNKRIHYSNDHTNGFKHRFVWSKKLSYIVNKNLYRLVFSRDNKRLLAKAIKSGEHDYLEIN